MSVHEGRRAEHAIRVIAVVTLTGLSCGISRTDGADSHPVERKSVKTSVVHVGPGRALARPSAAARIARNGDTIEIDAGIYDGDAAVWRQSGLTIRGVGGRARLRANGANAEGKAIWVIKGSNTTVENVEFSGAAAADANGAGIRLEGAGLTLRNCYFHHNQTGILTGSNDRSDIVIEHSEFAYNGAGEGQTHNIYIGAVRTFTLRFSYVHHAVVGHDVKSRALKNYIAYNRIMDESDGRSSYSVDLPNGGLSFLVGNVIQQGPAAANSGIISYGAEGYLHPRNELYVASNTIVNDLARGGRFIFVRAGAHATRMVNNVFAGPGQLPGEPGEATDNTHSRASDFVNPGGFDYRLRAGAPAIGRASDPGSAHGVNLRPDAEYVHKSDRRARRSTAKFDMGALEFQR